MTDEIIRLLPSKALRAKILETGYAFSEPDLLYIIYTYAPSEKIRTDMLLRFAKKASPEIAEHARRFAEWDKALFDSFRKNPNGEIYELNIMDSPLISRGPYICSSYPSVLEYIDLHNEEFKRRTNNQTYPKKYKIKKTAVFNGRNPEMMINDTVGVCHLDTDKNLLCVSDDSLEYESGDGRNLIVPHLFPHVLFPSFLEYGDIIKYTDNDFFERFGVCMAKSSAPDSGITVIALNARSIIYHAYEAIVYDLDVILPPNIELASLDDLDEEMRERYRELMEYLNEHPDE